MSWFLLFVIVTGTGGDCGRRAITKVKVDVVVIVFFFPIVIIVVLWGVVSPIQGLGLTSVCGTIVVALSDRPDSGLLIGH